MPFGTWHIIGCQGRCKICTIRGMAQLRSLRPLIEKLPELRFRHRAIDAAMRNLLTFLAKVSLLSSPCFMAQGLATALPPKAFVPSAGQAQRQIDRCRCKQLPFDIRALRNTRHKSRAHRARQGRCFRRGTRGVASWLWSSQRT